MNLEDVIKLQDILKLYPEYDSVLGPYTRKADGRKHIVLNNTSKHKGEKNKTRTISYPKALMEIYLGCRLSSDETVDHINEDFTDNTLENLQILSRSDNKKRSVVRRAYSSIHCQWCGKEFIPTRDQISHLDKPKFCSLQCRGKYSAEVRNKNIKPLQFTENLDISYYKNCESQT
nr:HNH endonuclease [uncultured phage]CAI9752268.1 HNH endonuclease [uncultured phage]